MIRVGWNNYHIASGGTVTTGLDPDVKEREQILERRTKSRVKRALQEAVSFGQTSQTDTLRGLSPTISARDLTEANQAKLLQEAYYLYKTNPFAMASIDIMSDFVVGEGFALEAAAGEDSDFQKELDLLWFNPNSNWEQRQENKVQELGLYGMQFYPVTFDKFTGRMQLGYLDPSRVVDVSFLKDDRGFINTEIIDKIWVIPPDGIGEPISFDAVRSDPATGKIIGEVFYFSVNRVSNAKFGTSDLLASLEWFDIFDQFLFGAAERNLLQESFVWHYTWEGLDDEEVEAKALKYKSAPKPGSIRHTNEKVKIEPLGPKNNGNINTKVMADLIKKYALSALRYPEHWLTEGGDTNFATAKAQGTPIFKRLTRRQKLWVANLNLLVAYAAQELLAKGMIDEEEVQQGWTVRTSDIGVENTEEKAKTLKSISESLATAEASNWISTESAADAFVREANQLGVQVERGKITEQSGEPNEGSGNNGSPSAEDREFAEALMRSRVPYLRMVRKVG